jgi:hypothetical protein
MIRVSSRQIPEYLLWCFYGFVALCIASYAGLGDLVSRLPYQGPDQAPARLVPYFPNGLTVGAQLAYSPSMVARFLGEFLTFGRVLPCTPSHVLGCYETPTLAVMVPQVPGFDRAWVILYVTAGIAAFAALLLAEKRKGFRALPSLPYAALGALQAELFLFILLTGMIAIFDAREFNDHFSNIVDTWGPWAYGITNKLVLEVSLPAFFLAWALRHYWSKRIHSTTLFTEV